jgi:L-asparaginase II
MVRLSRPAPKPMPSEHEIRRAERRPEPGGEGYPDNPVLVRVWRDVAVESQHRGAWCLCDGEGGVLDGAGAWERPIFTRSSVKCLQALPLLESGAAERFGLGEREVALAIASHNAEPAHTEIVAGMLARVGLTPGALRCGPHAPGDPEVRAQLAAEGREPSALHNNCSGKHAGFLVLARHLGLAPERYLDPEGEVQGLVRRAVLETTGLAPERVTTAVDGCSAPTFRIPLAALATAFARVATPEGPWPCFGPARRAACRRMLDAAAAHPELIAGRSKRLCTDIARATRGRVFPKIGAEAVYALGLCGRGRAIAVKIDDGGARALHALVVALLERFDLASAAELALLEPWREATLRNWAGIAVGRTEVLV